MAECKLLHCLLLIIILINLRIHFCSGVFVSRCKGIDGRTQECSEQMVWAWDTSRRSVQCAESDQDWRCWSNSGTADDSHAAVLAPVQPVLLLEYDHWGTQRDWRKCTSWNPSIKLWVYWPELGISWQVMKLIPGDIIDIDIWLQMIVLQFAVLVGLTRSPADCWSWLLVHVCLLHNILCILTTVEPMMKATWIKRPPQGRRKRSGHGRTTFLASAMNN